MTQLCHFWVCTEKIIKSTCYSNVYTTISNSCTSHHTKIQNQQIPVKAKDRENVAHVNNEILFNQKRRMKHDLLGKMNGPETIMWSKISQTKKDKGHIFFHRNNLKLNLHTHTHTIKEEEDIQREKVVEENRRQWICVSWRQSRNPLYGWMRRALIEEGWGRW